MLSKKMERQLEELIARGLTDTNRRHATVLGERILLARGGKVARVMRSNKHNRPHRLGARLPLTERSLHAFR